MTVKTKIKDRTGSVFYANGQKLTVISYKASWDVDIEFEDGTIVCNLHISNIKKGKVRNPNKPIFFNRGYIGIGLYNTKNNRKIYGVWKSMLVRCYSTKSKESNPTYIDIDVCKEWCNFQNFAKWYEENYREGFHLDKDILIKRNKVYSPETCVFVPQCINNLFTKRVDKKYSNFTGVQDSGNKFFSSIYTDKRNKYLGTFSTAEEAFQAYKEAKEQYIKEVADKWKDKISEKTYQAMYNYQVEITD